MGEHDTKFKPVVRSHWVGIPQNNMFLAFPSDHTIHTIHPAAAHWQIHNSPTQIHFFPSLRVSVVMKIPWNGWNGWFIRENPIKMIKFIRENPIKMDDLWVALFLEICIPGELQQFIIQALAIYQGSTPAKRAKTVHHGKVQWREWRKRIYIRNTYLCIYIYRIYIYICMYNTYSVYIYIKYTIYI